MGFLFDILKHTVELNVLLARVPQTKGSALGLCKSMRREGTTYSLRVTELQEQAKFFL